MKRALILSFVLFAVVLIVASLAAQPRHEAAQPSLRSPDSGLTLIQWEATWIDLTALPSTRLRWYARADAQFVVSGDGQLYAISPVDPQPATPRR